MRGALESYTLKLPNATQRSIMSTVVLRPYQAEAAISLVALLQRYGIAYLRGEVRTGKTFTALEAIRLIG